MNEENGTDKVHALQVERRLLEYFDRMAFTRLKFDERSLTIEENRGGYSKSFVYDLWRLNSNISIGKASNDFALSALRSGGGFLGAAAIVFFQISIQ